VKDLSDVTETFQTDSVEQTLALGEQLAGRLAVGDCLAMTGQLGAGKTALVRGIARGMGVGDERMVSSPTYVLVQEYPASAPIFHVDLYRLPVPEAELLELGLDEMLADGVVLIEWAERAGDALPKPRWELTITITGENSRTFELRRTD